MARLKAHKKQTDFMNDISDMETKIATEGLIKNNAQRQQHSNFANQLLNNKELREKAGGHVLGMIKAIYLARMPP
ncbi:hypothetical protein TM074_00065 [Candidatus Nanosynbacter sp. TM7-074]|uniref:Uncharacterized protein n=1 Tax=Candidatus Nanosynbacter sp. TM7-074 TaxID=3158573 RepID=A0AB39JCH7_9BACT